MKVATDTDTMPMSDEPVKPMEQYVFLTVPMDIAEGVEVGKEIEVSLKGIVKGITEKENEKDGKKYDIEIAVQKIESDEMEENEYEKMAKEEMGED